MNSAYTLKNPQEEHKMKKQMGIIMVLLITVFTGFGMIIPIMPELVKEPFHLGLMLALYSAVSFFLSPLWGALSDRIGRRPVIMIGLIGFGVSFFLFGIANDLLWMMYASRILGGFFSGAAVSSAVAYVADISSEEDRTKSMGLVGMSIGLGFILGPAIGGLTGQISLQLPFYIASGLSLFLAVFAYFYLTESLIGNEKQTTKHQKVSRWTAFAGSLKYLYVLSFFISFTLAGLESTLQYFQVIKIGATTQEIGMMFAVIGVVGALIQGGVVRRIKKGKETRYLLLGLLLTSFGFFLITFSSNFWTATLYLAIFGVGNALLRPTVTSLITQKTTVGQGVASGLNSSMDSLGRMSGPILGTLLFKQQIYLPYICGSIISILAIYLLYGYIKANKNQIKGMLH